MTHVKLGREPEFSMSGSGDDLSVFWNPPADPSATDSFNNIVTVRARMTLVDRAPWMVINN